MKHIIPFGDRILVRRKIIGDKLGKEGIIVAADSTAETPTDLAIVVYVPESTFTDKAIIVNAERIIGALTQKAREGSSEAFESLKNLNDYLKQKSINVGDEIMLGKYVGVTFHDNEGSGDLTLVKLEDVIGLVKK